MASPTANDPLPELISASSGAVGDDSAARRRLALATSAVRADRGQAGAAELARFRSLGTRSLGIDLERVAAAHQDRVVVVTGGTGCIGSAVVRALIPLRPRRIIVVSRGRTTRWPTQTGAEYVHLDICSAEHVDALFAKSRPDIVYHLAAQHDPGLAERQVARTLSTNIGGTINVVRACRDLGAVHLACASTGKALRPFSRDVYAASKKATEWVMRQAAADHRITTSAVRFTHVVDNSIILRRLCEWGAENQIVRLHDANSMFYIQSAREAAELLISSVLDPAPGVLTLEAIRDLGWPLSLLDLAVGVLAESGSHSPIHICGYEAGYERSPYPALYDPLLSGARSPLFNSLEVPELVDSPPCSQVDRMFAAPLPAMDVGGALAELARAAERRRDPARLREMVVEIGWSMLDQIVAALPVSILDRHERLVRRLRYVAWSTDDTRVRRIILDELRHRRAASAVVAV